MEKNEKFFKITDYKYASSTDISEPTNQSESYKNLSLTLAVHKPHGKKTKET